MPILVDISDISSNGETSIQANSSQYISSMLTIKIVIKRIAAFLNSFFLILDDKNIVNYPKGLQQIIYV